VGFGGVVSQGHLVAVGRRRSVSGGTQSLRVSLSTHGDSGVKHRVHLKLSAGALEHIHEDLRDSPDAPADSIVARGAVVSAVNRC
jgi:hypothetical protein